MSLLTIKKLIDVIDRILQGIDYVKKEIKERIAVVRAGRIRNAIDDGDVKYIKKIISNIKNKRIERMDKR